MKYRPHGARWRGDLVMLLDATDDLPRYAEILGFSYDPPEPSVGGSSTVSLEGSSTVSSEVPEHVDREERATARPEWPAVPFIQLVKQTLKAPPPPPEVRLPKPGGIAFQPAPAFTDYAGLDSWLFRRTSRALEIGPIHVDRLVRSLSEGTILAGLPRRAKHVWPRRWVLWLDRSPHMFMLWDEQDRVADSLVRRFGADRVSVRQIPSGDAKRGRSRTGGKTPPLTRADPDETHLVVSDLGCAGGSAVSAKWMAVGRRLMDRGVRPIALVPLSPWALPAVRAPWTFVPWDVRPAAPPRSDVPSLEDWLALSPRASLHTIRAVRALVGGGVEDEVSLLMRHASGAARLGLTLGATDVERGLGRVRQFTKRDGSVKLLRAIVAVFKAGFRHDDHVRHELVLRLDALEVPGLVTAQEVDEAAAFLTNAVALAEHHPDGAERSEYGAWLVRFAHANGLFNPAHGASRAADALARVRSFALTEEQEMDMQPSGDVLPPPTGAPIRRWSVSMTASGLTIADVDEGRMPDGHLWAQRKRVELNGNGVGIRTPNRSELFSRLELPLPATAVRLALGSWAKPDFANRAGEDEYGRWAEVDLDGVRFRCAGLSPAHSSWAHPTTNLVDMMTKALNTK